jgi:hypothetical protein
MVQHENAIAKKTFFPERKYKTDFRAALDMSIFLMVRWCPNAGLT